MGFFPVGFYPDTNDEMYFGVSWHHEVGIEDPRNLSNITTLYSIAGLKEGHQSGPHYAERQLGKPMFPGSGNDTSSLSKFSANICTVKNYIGCSNSENPVNPSIQ